ncbi:MAG: hypothetical protein AAF363_08220 [Bacteroidota bacterium]
MKKIFTLLFGAVLFLSVAGCDDEEVVPDTNIQDVENGKEKSVVVR